MTFLNRPLLWGLFGIAIPIIIHLLNRRKAAVVEWGAMRFLLASLASRNRRILVEEILLMAVRCLAVGLIAAAMSRPLLPSGDEQWAVTLAVLPAAALLGALAAAVMWPNRAVRWACLAAAAVLLAAAGTSLVKQEWSLVGRWAPASGSQDIAIVIDGSLSMTVQSELQTNFQRAVDEARAIVGGCRPSDTVSIILGGSTPQDIVVPGATDRGRLAAELAALRPSGGSMRVVPSLMAAGAALARGHNPGRKIVLITDGQSVGWDLPGGSTQGSPQDGGSAQNEERWRWLAGNLAGAGEAGRAGAGGQRPTVICRMLPEVKSFKNLCVDEITFSRNVVGTDRPVRIDAKVSNTGTVLMAGAAVDLIVNGTPIGRRALEEVPPGGSQVVHFMHQFETAGAKLIEARLLVADDLPGDNSAFARLDVAAELPVLIVEGEPSAGPLGGAGQTVQIALSPISSTGFQPVSSTGILPVHASSSSAAASAFSVAASAASSSPSPSKALFHTTLIDAASLASLGGLEKYKVIVLAGVPALPDSAAGEVAAFVQRGGGLLILPGDFKPALGASPTAFYDSWTASGRPVCPAKLARRLADLDAPVHPAPQTFSHPALAVLADPALRYAASVLIRSYWELQPDEKDPEVRVGGRLESGHPFLVDRKLGEGRVVMLCTSLDYRQSNLPAVWAVVPLVHELAYYLCGAIATRGNVPSGQEAVLDVPPRLTETALGRGRDLEVVTPLGTRRPAQIVDMEGARRLVFAETDSPGVYRVVMPGAAGGSAFSSTPGPGSEGRPEEIGHATSASAAGAPAASAPATASPATGSGRDDLFFVVPNQPQESRLDRLSPADLRGVEKALPVATAGSAQELVALVHGGTPGMEIWQELALCGVLALVAEVALTHWIARKRKVHGAAPVAFGEEDLITSIATSGLGMTGVGTTGIGTTGVSPVDSSTKLSDDRRDARRTKGAQGVPRG